MTESRPTKRLEIIVALFGVAITAVLGLSQWSLGQRQNQILADQTATQEKLAVDQIEIQTMNLVAQHLEGLLENDLDGERSEKVVLAAAEFLSAEHQRTSLAEIASKLIKQRPTSDPETEGRFVEATQPAKRTARWFTVVGSYGISMLNAAESAADRMQQNLSGTDPKFSVEIYRTKHSDHYAVVVGGAQTKEEANKLALRARTEGWAEDAYSQVDRDWTRVGRAPFE